MLSYQAERALRVEAEKNNNLMLQLLKAERART
jgi:hypothetical protein